MTLSNPLTAYRLSHLPKSAWRTRIAGVIALALLCAQQMHGATETPVNLGSDSSFAILASTGVSVTGGGTITGNIGIFPGTAFVPGNPPVTVNGTIYASGPVASQAQADLTIAYNDAAGRTTPALVSGNLGGQTLTPGLYKSTSSLAISSGDLTLDAQGNPNAVFIFQIASTLTMTSGRQVILAGGARAGNIFWQVGSSATIGTTAVLHGTILAAVSISVLTGATLDGRALASTGAVSLDTGGGTSVTAPVAPIGPTVTATAPMNGATGAAINGKLAVTFSTSMDPTSITSSSWTVMNGTTPVAGTITTSATISTFTPTATLAANTTFTATVTTAAKDLSGNPLARAYTWTFTTGATPDTTPPTVLSTVPANAATAVATNEKISAIFSESMDAATITTTTMTVFQGATAISGTVTYAGTTATFAPTAALIANTTYAAAITTGAKDLAGNAIASVYGWSFTTSATADTTAPTVTTATPVNGAIGVSATAPIAFTFSNAMDPATVTTATITVQHGGTAVPGTVSSTGNVATFTPSVPLTAGTAYTVTVGTGTADLAGNSLATAYVGTFTTAGTAPVIVSPTITSTTPANGATLVAVTTTVTATFSTAMDPATITTSTFILMQGTTVIPGAVTYANDTATFTLSAPLAYATLCSVTVSSGATDTNGTPLAAPVTWSFATAAGPGGDSGKCGMGSGLGLLTLAFAGALMLRGRSNRRQAR